MALISQLDTSKPAAVADTALYQKLSGRSGHTQEANAYLYARMDRGEHSIAYHIPPGIDSECLRRAKVTGVPQRCGWVTECTLASSVQNTNVFIGKSRHDLVSSCARFPGFSRRVGTWELYSQDT